MPRKKPKNPVGHPKCTIDPETVHELAQIQCTMPEMARILRTSEDTLHRNFAGVIADGRAHGVMSVKRLQYTIAMTGDKDMLKWYGKNYGGQRDQLPDNYVHIENFQQIRNAQNYLASLQPGELVELFYKKEMEKQNGIQVKSTARLYDGNETEVRSEPRSVIDDSGDREPEGFNFAGTQGTEEETF